MTLLGASSKVKALVDEGQAIHRAAAKANLMQPRYMTRVRIDVRGMSRGTTYGILKGAAGNVMLLHARVCSPLGALHGEKNVQIRYGTVRIYI